MATIDQTANTKSVDASLWWDSFTLLLNELESVSLSSDLPPYLVQKLKDNRAWFLDTVSRFKTPNQKSRETLNSRQVKVGSHLLTVQPNLRDAALKISSILCLDEVQTYILVKRSVERNTLAVDFIVEELVHLVVLQYYIERQCLLKCTRQIFMHALNVGNGTKDGSAITEEARKLISEGLESRLLSVLQDLLLSYHPEHMDLDLVTLWAEETLIEDTLVLDILFLAYYESFCICDGQQWKMLCLLYEGIVSGSYNVGKLAVSSEAIHSISLAKVQLLLVLVETLDLENLLQMIHDEMPFRQGSTAFSLVDIQEIDAVISRFNAFETKEEGPLILAWAVYLCLISSLPGKQENNVLMEIDHVGYVRQAFEVSSLSYFLEIIQSNILKDSDGPIAGYRCVLRTFISAFIASYEISLDLEDDTLKLILDILCKIYRGEESLCIQFWDRDSFVDGPIRCLLCNLEGEFPYKTVELARLLSALCEGTWPAECVYNFLDKSVGVSSLFELGSDSLVDNNSQIVEARMALCVPGVEGLVIPSKTRGQVLKVIDGNTALVRWEYTQSGVLVLVLHLAQEMYLEGTEEVLVILDLLSRLVSFNTAVCFALVDMGNSFHNFHGKATHTNGHREQNLRVNVVEIICTLVRKLSPNSGGAAIMSRAVAILAKMLKCSPFHVSSISLKANIFDVDSRTNPFHVSCDGLSSGSWFLSGRLAKLILIDCEHNDSCCPLILSVLDFTLQLVETGVESDIVLALVGFSLRYVVVDHEYWKYKIKHVRWKVTLKVLEVMKKCVLLIPYNQKLNEVVRDTLLSDSSIHNALFRIVCTTTQALEKLYFSRLYELMEIEGLQLAICSALEVLFCMLSDLSKDILPSLPVFHQAMLSTTTKPIPVVTAMMSLISCFRNPMIQVGAARVLSMLFDVADYSQQYAFGNACFGLDDKQVKDFRQSLKSIFCEKAQWNQDLFVASVKLLTSAALHQPAFLVAVIAATEKTEVQLSNGDVLKQSSEATSESPSSKEVDIIGVLLQYVGNSGDLIKSDPRILLNVLNFLKALWQGAGQFINILDRLKSSGDFWRQLSDSFLLIGNKQASPSENLSDMEILSLAYRYQCQSAVLQIMAYEMFLQKKLSHAESLVEQTSESLKRRIQRVVGTEKRKDASRSGPEDILSNWCERSVLGEVIKSFAYCEYDNDIYLHAKTAAGLLAVHVMGKMKSGDTGSLSLSLIEKIHTLLKKLTELPAFSESIAQYTQRGYSEGKEVVLLIVSDLYYHLQGELEGRKIDPGPFKELSQFLLNTNFLQTYQCKYDEDLFANAKDVYLFDSTRLRADLGLDMWDYSDWKSSKAVAESLLLCLQDANSMVLLANSKLSALRALTTTLAVYEEDSAVKKSTKGGKIPEHCIDHICQCLRSTIESFASVLDASEYALDFIAAQAELLLHLIRSAHTRPSLHACVLVLKTLGSGLKVLSDFRPSVAGVRAAKKLFLMLLLLSVNLSWNGSLLDRTTEMECVEDFAELSNASLGLLPVLCNCVEPDEHCTLSLTTIDVILKGFLSPNTWVPIIHKHLQLQHVIQKLQDKNSLASKPIILKFLLTLARVREGAEMLLTANFFPSLRVLFSDLSDGSPFLLVQSEKPQHFWGLGLAVVAAVINSLGENASCTDVVDYVITYFFLEKAYLVPYYLSALDFPSDDHDKKRARAQKTHTSLGALRETEHTLLLLCMLAKRRNSWIKAMKQMDSQLRERSIHLLGFISRGTQRPSESSSWASPLLCKPILKEEIEWCNKPAFVNIRNGWFSLAPLGCSLHCNFSSAVTSQTTALVIKDQAAVDTDSVPQTHFSDMAAVQIYRLAFLLLKFLCIQAEGASERAEDVGFVDLAHFPELPVPDILHGLQDQAIAIISELCEVNKLKEVSSEIQEVCILLLKIAEMALYLEFCVLQICGIRPVLGRVEDFSKELRLLIRATEGHVFLRSSVTSLKQIISFVYPGLLQAEGF